MPLATNPLLQATQVAKNQAAAASTAVKSADTGKDSASSFSQVYAKQADSTPKVSVEPRAKAAKDKPDVVESKPKADHKTAANKTTVADNGKSLPADKASKKAVADDSDSDDDDDGASADDKATSSTVADASAVAPAVDASLTQAQPVQPTPDPAPPVAVVPTPTVDVPPTVLAAVTPPPAPTPANDAKAFDPASDDPLAGLSAVQVALEQNGKSTKPGASTQASTQASTSATASTAASSANTNTDPSQVAVNNLAVPVDPQSTDSNNAGAGDKAFKNLIDDGLKDSSVATTDTKVDDFASRIAALSEAAQPKAVVAPTASPLAQPLAMHQSGWSEGVVDRVMYLSSQNLKSADIQLEPAELGRLDIRVNMAPDQQTQITFMSSHPAVREALEGQMGKLRDSFTQQGLGQVDVNVSDQSRGWSGQGQNQQQANQSQRSGSGSDSSGGSGSGNGLDDGAIADVAQAVQPMKIIGTSQVDYYA